MRRLPPLIAMRAFEAAARHGSFSLAAAELNITPAAVSQQVRYLEARLDVCLFIRRPRAVQITPSGLEYAQALGIALDQIAAATERVTTADRLGKLTVATTPSFAVKWLIPRLIRFQRRYPELDVRLSTSNSLIDFSRQDVDLAVRYGRGQWPGVATKLLMTTELFPVCSPALLDAFGPLRTPKDLRRHTRLHLSVDSWPKWLAAAGVDGLNAHRGPTYDDAGLLIQAAIEGQGIALGQRVLVEDDLAAGRLVRPFPLGVSSEAAYYVATPAGGFQRGKVKAFCDWLLEEAGPSRDAAPEQMSRAVE